MSARAAPGKTAFAYAPCKLNLHLEVGPKRADGYHGIASLFQLLSLSDRIKVRVPEPNRGDFGLQPGDLGLQPGDLGPQPGDLGLQPGDLGLQPGDLVLGLEGVPPERNSLLSALKAFRRATGIEDAVEISVEKRIPEGAGLGGGSSDAASCLKALDLLFGTGLSSSVLEGLALGLGSDVPFFIDGACALVGGRGEELEHIPARRDLAFALVWPGFSSSTTECYARFDLGKGRGAREPVIEGLKEAYALPPGGWPFFNDLLAPAVEAHPGIVELIGALEGQGSLFAAMSGSGSACFAVFPGLAEAARAVKALKKAYPRGFACFPLARSPKPILQ